MTALIDMKECFSGGIRGWGIIQNWRGKAISRFDMKIIGTWDGDHSTLNETFFYYNDGETQKRKWEIIQKGELYEATAEDIHGIARGKIHDNAINWQYTIDLEVANKKHRLKVDDWMWQMSDGVMINRSYFKKFGIVVAKLTVCMQKV